MPPKSSIKQHSPPPTRNSPNGTKNLFSMDLRCERRHLLLTQRASILQHSRHALYRPLPLSMGRLDSPSANSKELKPFKSHFLHEARSLISARTNLVPIIAMTGYPENCQPHKRSMTLRAIAIWRREEVIPSYTATSPLPKLAVPQSIQPL